MKCVSNYENEAEKMRKGALTQFGQADRNCGASFASFGTQKALDGGQRLQAADVQDGKLVENCPAGKVSPQLREIVEDYTVQFLFWAWALLVPTTACTIVYAIPKENAVSTCNPAAYLPW